MPSITIGDKTVTAGLMVEATKIAEEMGLCPTGLRPIIHRISEINGEWQFALYSKGQKVDGWHDLEGELPNKTAFWVTIEELIAGFAFANDRAEVKGIVMFKNRNLKGMTGRILGLMDGAFYFLEFDEDIGGCSADGLGKAGHCVAINREHLNLGDNKFKLFKEE